jgi:O-antigen ligase
VQLKQNVLLGLTASWLLYWVMLGGTFGGALSWRHQAIAHTVFFLVFTTAGWRLWRTSLPPKVSLLAPAQNLILALILIDLGLRAAVRQSWNSREVFVNSIATWILFYLLLKCFGRDDSLASACILAAVACVIVGTILARMQGYRELALPLGNRVLMAGLLTVVAPLAIGFAQGASRARMVLGVLGAGIIVAGIVETRSAAAMAILPFSMLSSVMVGRKRIRYFPVFVLGLLGVSVAVWFSKFEPLVRIKSVITRGADTTSSWDNRVRYWTGSLNAIKEKPLLGWGAGQVGISYPPYRIQRSGFAPSGEVIADLHSVPLQWAFEFGLTGTILRLVGFGFFLALEHSQKTVQQKTAVIALATFGVFSLLNYNLGNPATVLVVLVVAVIAAPRFHGATLTVRSGNRIGLLLICCATAMFVFQTRLDYANYLLAKSSQQPHREAADSLIRASLLDARGGFYDAAAAIRVQELLKGLPSDEPFLLEAATKHYARALTYNPWSPQLMAAQGAFLLGHARSCEAINFLEKAVSLDFYFSLSHFDLANAYRSCGSMDQAVSEAGIAILTTPITVFSTEWRRKPQFLADALDEALRWLDGWKSDATISACDQVRRLKAFLRVVREAPVGGNNQTTLNLSEPVGDRLTSDPFAYIFQRQCPVFEPTTIQLDGLDSGTWAPEGIGRIKYLRPMTYGEVANAYRQRKLDSLVCFLVGNKD